MKTYLRYSNPKDLNEVEYMIDLENGIGNLVYCYEGFLERGGDKTTPIIISGNSIIEIVDGKPVLNLATLRTQLLEQAKSEVSSKLQETDYIVLRQFERKEANKATKLLNDTEFIAFSDGRQALRDKLNTYETAINNAKTYDEIMGVKYGEWNNWKNVYRI